MGLLRQDQGGMPEQMPGRMPPEQMEGQDTEELKRKAVEYAYGKKFDSLVKMFQANGPEGFARSMAVAINGALQNIGPMTHEQAAEVGMHLYLVLLEDVITGDLVPGVTAEQVSQVLPETIKMYAESHPDVSEQDIQALMEQLQARAAQTGA